jgi:hypothetical protein
VPFKLGVRKELAYLHVDKNKLIGMVPLELGQLLKVQKLGQLRNYINLATYVNLANLLYIFNNSFIECILEELGNYSTLNLFRKKLGGPIPRIEYESTKPLTSSYFDSLNGKG